MSAILGIGVQVVTATLLIVAGAQKLAAPDRFEETLRAIDLPLVRSLVVGVPLMELLTASLILVRPFPLLAAVLIVILGGSFGAAGLMALLQRKTVQCACFGPLGDGTLGTRQLAAVPLWLIAAASTLYLPGVSGATGVAVIAALALSVGIAVASYLLIRLRSRASVEEAYSG